MIKTFLIINLIIFEWFKYFEWISTLDYELIYNVAFITPPPLKKIQKCPQ